MSELSFRQWFACGAVICAALLGYALYVEHGMFMMPCPLCILQRMAFMGMGFGFLFGALHNPAQLGRRLYAFAVALFGLAGALIAGRHLWMQYAPPESVPSCSGMDISYMVKAFPFQEVVSKVLTGSGECAQIDWTFLGVPMPGWTLLMYALLTLLAFYASRAARRV